jgi:hypothetical protein
MLTAKEHHDRNRSSSRSRSNARPSSSVAVTSAATPKGNSEGKSGEMLLSAPAKTLTFGALDLARGCEHFTNYEINADGSDMAVQQLLALLKGKDEGDNNHHNSDSELKVSFDELEASWSKLVSDTSSVSSSPRPPLRPNSPPLLKESSIKGDNSRSRSSSKHRSEASSPKLSSQTQQAPTGEDDVLSLLVSSSAATDSKELLDSAEGSSCGTSDNEGSSNADDADDDDEEDKGSGQEGMPSRTSHVTPLALSFK